MNDSSRNRSRYEIPRKEVRTEVVTGNRKVLEFPQHNRDHVRHAFDGDTTLVPLGQRLRGNSDQPSERDLRAASSVTPFQRRVHETGVLHSQLPPVNSKFTCRRAPLSYNKPMVYPKGLPNPPSPGDFRTFADWLRAFVDGHHGAQSELAKLARVRSQAVTRWRNGAIPKPETLKRLADALSLSYAELSALANGANLDKPTVTRDALTAQLLDAWRGVADAETAYIIIEHIRALAALGKRSDDKGNPKIASNGS